MAHGSRPPRQRDRAISARYGFHLGDCLYEYRSGSDPMFNPRISTGLQAAQLCVEATIARGLTTYDLGEGPRPYKLRWNHARRQTENLWITRRNSRTLARALIAFAGKQARELRRAIDPPPPPSSPPG